MKLTIKRNENVKGKKALVGRNYRYWIDDLEITDSLTKVVLTLGPDEANRAIVVMRVTDGEIDVDALLEAGFELDEHVEGTEAGVRAAVQAVREAQASA